MGDVELFEAGNLDTVLATLDAQPQIDLVLLDLHMPGNHGLAGLAAVRAQYPGVAVIVVSANDDPRVVRRALDHGAAGYLPKSSGLDELRDAIQAKDYRKRAADAAQPVLDADKQHDKAIDDAGG